MMKTLALALALFVVAPHSTNAQPAPAPTAPQARKLTFNGRAATSQDLQTLASIEQLYGQPVPAGDYWYDARSGAAGKWGGPTLGFLAAGLALGGPLPANASGGGNGKVTGVFINGRELHPTDVQVLILIYGKALQGRWWVDGQGNAGAEGGPAQVNLIALAQQLNPKAASTYYRRDGKGGNAFGSGKCRSGSIPKGSGSDKTTIDYYIGCG
jgi:hypothetical protein